MPGQKPAYPDAVREYVLAQVIDAGRKILPVVDDLHRGAVAHLGKVPVSYSVARGWVADEKGKRDAAAPLTGPETLDYDRRLWAVGKRELRKLERDTAKAKPLDAKRLNDLAAFSARMAVRVERREKPADTNGAATTGPGESLLDRLARDDQAAAAEPATPDLTATTPTDT